MKHMFWYNIKIQSLQSPSNNIAMYKWETKLFFMSHALRTVAVLLVPQDIDRRESYSGAKVNTSKLPVYDNCFSRFLEKQLPHCFPSRTLDLSLSPEGVKNRIIQWEISSLLPHHLNILCSAFRLPSLKVAGRLFMISNYNSNMLNVIVWQ